MNVTDDNRMEFTAHNIALPDGSYTMSAERGPFEDSGRCRAAVTAIESALGNGDRSRVRVADLGALEGGYAVALARRGFDVTGIEGRSINIAKCRLVEERCAWPNLRFVHDDIRHLDRYGPFDAVVCAGVLYHLDEPARFLEHVGRCTRRLVVIETHYADDREPPGVTLGPWTTHDGRRGRWYNEWPEDTPPEAIEASVWASIGNSRSFWLGKPALLDAIRAAGFTNVAEPPIEGADAEDEVRLVRTLLVATRP